MCQHFVGQCEFSSYFKYFSNHGDFRIMDAAWCSPGSPTLDHISTVAGLGCEATVWTTLWQGLDRWGWAPWPPPSSIFWVPMGTPWNHGSMEPPWGFTPQKSLKTSAVAHLAEAYGAGQVTSLTFAKKKKPGSLGSLWGKDDGCRCVMMRGILQRHALFFSHIFVLGQSI